MSNRIYLEIEKIDNGFLVSHKNTHDILTEKIKRHCSNEASVLSYADNLIKQAIRDEF